MYHKLRNRVEFRKIASCQDVSEGGSEIVCVCVCVCTGEIEYGSEYEWG